MKRTRDCHKIATDPTLTYLAPHIAAKSFSVEAYGYVGLCAHLGTDTFVQDFVKEKTNRDIINDVGKLDKIEDGLIHYQLLRFRQATPLQYLNSYILLRSQIALPTDQQQHADFKIIDALIKEGAKQSSFAW